jgi:hypothetical protein
MIDYHVKVCEEKKIYIEKRKYRRGIGGKKVTRGKKKKRENRLPFF